MSHQSLLKPTLYRAGERAPELLGGECEACGYRFFPLQAYGCEMCGSLALKPKAFAGSGRLAASTVVHLHAGKGRQAPFVVGTITLDDGPVVRTLLSSETALPVGTRLTAELVEVTTGDPPAPALDLRFKAEG